MWWFVNLFFLRNKIIKWTERRSRKEGKKENKMTERKKEKMKT